MLAASELDHLLVDHAVTLEALHNAMLQTHAQESTIGHLQSDLSCKAGIADVLHTRLMKANQKAFAAKQGLSKAQALHKQLLEDDCLTKATEELASATACIAELEQDLLQTHLRPLNLMSVAVQTSPPSLSSVGIQASAPTSYTSSGIQTIPGKLSNPTPHPPTIAPTSYAQAVQRQHSPAIFSPPSLAPPAVSPASTGFKGSRATKATELHFYIRLQPVFNQRLARSFLEPMGCNRINHHHTLADSFILAMYRVVNKRGVKLLPKLNGHVHNGAPPPAPIQAVFWSPKGNLTMWTKKAITDNLQTLLLAMVTFLCGSKSWTGLPCHYSKSKVSPPRTIKATPWTLNRSC